MAVRENTLPGEHLSLFQFAIIPLKKNTLEI